jgi:hypothetical protein
MHTNVTYVLSLVRKLWGESFLDIGARNTDLAEIFKAKGFTSILLVDKNFEKKPEGFLYEEIDLIDFKPSQNYDVVVCRHTLPFTKDPLGNMEKILSFGTTCFFTFFGPQDDRKNLSITKESIEKTLARHTHISIVYRDEIEYDGLLYSGDIIHWHVFTYVTTKKA